MKQFSKFFAEARPQDYVNRKTKDEVDAETLTLTPRSKGEQDFKDKHEVELTKHPVAANNQFKSTESEDESDHKGFKPGKGDTKAPEQGTSTLSKFMNKISANQTPLRKGDKRQGDLKPIMAKEEYQGPLLEGVVENLQQIAKSKKGMEVKFKNGKTLDVDTRTANAILKTMKDLKPANKKKMEKALEAGPSSFMKMMDFAMM